MAVESYDVQAAAVTTTINHPTNTISVIGVGGCGINLANQIGDLYEATPVAERKHYSRPQVVNVDSSRQNVRYVKSAKDDNTYIIRKGGDVLKNPHGNELDGGGGDRSFLREIAPTAAKEVASKWPFNDVVVVAFSAHGATGGTVGLQIMKEALAAQKQVYAIVVGGTTGAHRQHATNAVKLALLKYQTESGRGLGFFYAENAGMLPSDEALADQAVIDFWTALSLIHARTAMRLDGRDIENALQVHRITGGDPQLFQLFTAFNDDELERAPTPVCVIGNVTNQYTSTPGAQQVLAGAKYAKLGVHDIDANQPLPTVFLLATRVSDDFVRAHSLDLQASRTTLQSESAIDQKLMATFVNSDDVF